MEPRMEPNKVESLFKYGIDYQLHKRKGKQYISQKAPADIAFMYADGRYRLSTGTSDKAVAKAKAQEYLRKIEDHFDRSRRKLDPFVEGLRPYLESQGVNVISWYQNDFVEHELVGEATILWSLTGGKYDFTEKFLDAGMWSGSLPAFRGLAQETLYSTAQREPLELKNDGPDNVYEAYRVKVPDDANWDTYFERFIADDYATLAELVTRLGGFVPTHLLDQLDDNDVQVIEELKKPLNPDVVLLYSDQLPNGELLESIKRNANHLPRTPQVVVADAPPDQVRFSDVVEEYLASKTEASKERSQRLKACETVIRICGDRPLAGYTKLDAYDIAKSMHEDGYSRSQISKMITYGRGLFKYATKTRGTNGEALLLDQPWKDIELDDYGKEKRKYKPLTVEELHALFALDMGEQERLLLSILISTGMRLDEVALMTWERIREYEHVLCFCLVNDNGDERFKNRGSMRYVPVPKIIMPMLNERGQGRVFGYRVDRDGKAQAAASDAVMPLIRKITKDDRKVAHSLRGNFKDALRELEVSKELNDFITGHAQGDVGGRYGEGPSLKKRLEVINRIQHPWFNMAGNN
jgi:integrase